MDAELPYRPIRSAVVAGSQLTIEVDARVVDEPAGITSSAARTQIETRPNGRPARYGVSLAEARSIRYWQNQSLRVAGVLSDARALSHHVSHALQLCALA